MFASTQPVKALSVRQPWADDILYAGKTVENRSWPTKYRGPLIIHASKNHDRTQLRHRTGCTPTAAGALLGRVNLTDVHHATECGMSCSPWADPNQWHWVLSDPQPLAAPITCPGRLGVWTVPAELIDRTRRQVPR